MVEIRYNYLETNSENDKPVVDEMGNDVSMYNWLLWGIRNTPEEIKFVWRREVTQ